MNIRLRTLRALGGALLGLVALSAWSQQQNVTVQATADLFNAVAPGAYQGTQPVAIDVTGVSDVAVFISGIPSLTVDGGVHYNNADGIGSASGIVSTGAGGLSGITSAYAGFLAGVFVGPSISLTAPFALAYTTNGATTDAQSKPLLQQTFYIGDGMSGGNHAISTTQPYAVPTGAKTLYLGFVDACGSNGAPGCYDDNSGSVSFVISLPQIQTPVVPEPASIALMAAGLGGVGAATRRKRSSRAITDQQSGPAS